MCRGMVVGLILTSCAALAAEPELRDRESRAAGKVEVLKAADVAAVRKMAEAEYGQLFEIYKQLHSHPELSLKEERTGKRIAELLKEAGYEVTGGVGGHGVVAMLRNGKGPTIMWCWTWMPCR